MTARRRSVQDDVRKIALALPRTEESQHMGRPDLRVGGKILATLPQDGRSVNVRVDRMQLWNGQMLGVDLRR
jgi:hypothetical protein